MDSLENHGIIIRDLRKMRGLSIQKTAELIEKSAGWLCEVENGVGTCRLLPSEFERIVLLLDGSKYRPMFRTWVANHKNLGRIDHTYDGAVLKFIRLKKGLSLEKAAEVISISSGYLSKLETGAKPMTLSMRKRLMTTYGYQPNSFKNLATDPVRSKAVPNKFKFQILMRTLGSKGLENLYASALSQPV